MLSRKYSYILVSLFVVVILTPLPAVAGDSIGTSEINEATLATPTSPAENAIKLGVKALENGDENSAFANFSEAVRLDPNNPKAFLARALAFGLKSEWDNAIADCTEAIRLDPKNAFLGYFCRGDVYMKKHDHNKAIADYTKAIQLDPNNAGVYDSRGTAYENKGEKSKAEADFKEAKRLEIKSQLKKEPPSAIQKQHWQRKPTNVLSQKGNYQERIHLQKEKHERLMAQARKERAAQEQRWRKEWEAEKERRSRERIAAMKAEAKRKARSTPINIHIVP